MLACCSKFQPTLGGLALAPQGDATVIFNGLKLGHSWPQATQMLKMTLLKPVWAISGPK